jgi:hypothetical protein
MAHPPIISLTDCSDPNAVARQSARLAALFGRTPTVLPLAGPDPEGAAALTLLDVLRATELLGGAGEPTVILVNIAPRDGHWPNGVPFCYFRYRDHLVVSTFNPRVLELVGRHLGVAAVEVTDVREALEAAAAQWAEFSPAEVEEITRTQFRSLWYVPLLARWLVDGRPVPARTEPLDAAAPGPRPVRVAVVDNFGNCKLDAPAHELDGYTARAELELAGPDGAVHRVRCYDRLPDVPRGEAGVVTGSSGIGFAELVVRGGSAAVRFGLREGDRVCTLAPAADRSVEPILVG